jgi:superoxide dismutase, Cu-Zn family
MPKSVKAIAVLNSPNCKGTINISEANKGGLTFDINLTNLTPGKHGFHIHEAGNLEDGCKSCCAHFNPLNKEHGGTWSVDGKNRHLGDLGNIEADLNGNCKTKIFDKYLQLRGYKYNIIGRSIVVHQDPDDLGLGGNAESKKTGNAGPRIGCGVIGYKEGYYF